LISTPVFEAILFSRIPVIDFQGTIACKNAYASAACTTFQAVKHSGGHSMYDGLCDNAGRHAEKN
jgi:hypothetical protein